MIKVSKSPVNNFEGCVFAIHEHITGFYVTMYDASRVSIFKPKKQLEDVLLNAGLCQVRVETSEILILYILKN